MDRRQTLTMINWDGLRDNVDDDDRFFESCSNASSGSDDGDDDFEDSRMSFASAVSSSSSEKFCPFKPTTSPMLEDYNMWMEEPGSIKDRRKRLLQGMGLTSKKSFSIASSNFNRVLSRNHQLQEETTNVPPPPPPPTATSKPLRPEPESMVVLVRSRSDGDLASFSVNARRRKEELIGDIPKQKLTKTCSLLLVPCMNISSHYANSVRMSPMRERERRSVMNSGAVPEIFSDDQFGTVFMIKNLDTGKEFVVKDVSEDGMWYKLNDTETGKQLSMEEFEKSVGYSPVVKDLMRRENAAGSGDDGRKINANNYFQKSFRYMPMLMLLGMCCGVGSVAAILVTMRYHMHNENKIKLARN